jgi:hypothetical protein
MLDLGVLAPTVAEYGVPGISQFRLCSGLIDLSATKARKAGILAATIDVAPSAAI